MRTSPSASAGSILVVEDDEALREGLCHALLEQGFVVVEAASADAALHALSQGGIDLLLTDMRLPGPSGLDLLCEARRADLLARTEVLLVSGDDGARDLPDVDVLMKPFSLEVLIRRVRACLGKRSSRAS